MSVARVSHVLLLRFVVGNMSRREYADVQPLQVDQKTQRLFESAE